MLAMSLDFKDRSIYYEAWVKYIKDQHSVMPTAQDPFDMESNLKHNMIRGCFLVPILLEHLDN